MAMATCWNCGARVAGPTCQMCGAAQQAGGAEGPPAYVPGGQPVVSQASMSVRSPQPTAGSDYASGSQYQYPSAGQAGGWQGQPPMPGQGGWQGNPQQGYRQQPGYPPPGSQPPSAYQQQQAYRGAQPAGPAVRQRAVLDPMGLVLGLVCGTVGGIIGAIIWAAVLNLTNYNLSLIAVVLGWLVGFAVLLGARGQRHFVLAIVAGAVGLASFFFALYLRVSYWEGLGFTGLPIGNFTSAMSDYLHTNPFNYVYFVLVPLIAAGTTLRTGANRRTVRRR